jgi:hypothetical protein
LNLRQQIRPWTGLKFKGTHEDGCLCELQNW